MLKVRFTQPATMVAIALISLTSLSACSFERKVDYELTGMVMDADTKKPLEGVYVVAVYMGGGLSLAGSAAWCEKTLGMTTQADGKFHFPARDEKGRTPQYPVAIKPGYAYAGYQITNESQVTSDRKLYFTDQNVLLAPQDPAKPQLNFVSNKVTCSRAATKGEAAAGIEFLKLQLVEFSKYGMPQNVIESEQSMIRRLDALPDAPSPHTKSSSPL
jgi:hypothetical protein